MRVIRSLAILAVSATALSACTGQRIADDDPITISLLGTNDVHGQLSPEGDRGGLIAISAYVNALRAARAEDGGAVLVIDAGDMWQGTLESNLVEGASVVDAFNAIGFDAAAIGNHEFDFGPVGDRAVPEEAGDDPRGALKLGAARANFPLLAANLIEIETGRPVAWPNVAPSAMLDAGGVRVCIVGVMSAFALQATIAANTEGLRVAPLAETIIREATALRNRGASIVIVTAHAGGSCQQFDDPLELSSCNMDSEIMRVAEAIPRGLVDHIFAGHAHQGIAHIVNGISITSAYSNTRAFSRVDFRFDRQYGRVVSRNVHPPQRACLAVLTSSGGCAPPDSPGAGIVGATYEGRELSPDPAIVDVADRAAARVAGKKQEPLGVRLASDFLHPPATESPLANLMTRAMRESTGADISIEIVVGGIRDILPAGELTYGDVYEMFPFDNRVVFLELSGRQLRDIIAAEAQRKRRRAGYSGMRVIVSCDDGHLNIVMRRPDGSVILDGDELRVVTNDYLALGGENILVPVIPPDGIDIDYSQPLTRDVLLGWFRRQGGTLTPDDFMTTANPKWYLPESLPASCAL